MLTKDGMFCYQVQTGGTEGVVAVSSSLRTMAGVQSDILVQDSKTR